MEAEQPLLRGLRRQRNGDIAVQVLVRPIGPELSRSTLTGVGRVGTDREAEGVVRTAPFQEFESLIPEAGGLVRPCGVAFVEEEPGLGPATRARPLRGGYEGVMPGIDPALRFVDITHLVPPGDVFTGAFVLGRVLTQFPLGTIHLDRARLPCPGRTRARAGVRPHCRP